MAPRPKPRFRPWRGLRKEDIELAKRRTEYLLERWPMDAQTIPIKLANAYLQGIADAAEVQREEKDNEGTDRSDAGCACRTGGYQGA